MELEDNILLAKWLNHTISPDELKQLELEVDLEALKAILDQQQSFELAVVEKEEMWKNFMHRIEKTDTKRAAAFKVPENKNSINTKKRLFIISSIILVGFLGLFIYKFLNDPIHIETKPQERKIQKLADGSSIEISPGTTIYYFDKNWKNERKIQLNGQAYFEVTEGQPFYVQTAVGVVKVLGTSFDIWSFGEHMQVQCFSGKVSIENTKSGQSVILEKGQELSLNKSTLGTIASFTERAPNWIENKQQVYKGIPANLVIQDIQRYHGISVNSIVTNPQAEFSGLIVFDSVENSARYLAEAMGWKYTVTKDEITFTQ